jgi:hypothetical protein
MGGNFPVNITGNLDVVYFQVLLREIALGLSLSPYAV